MESNKKGMITFEGATNNWSYYADKIKPIP